MRRLSIIGMVKPKIWQNGAGNPDYRICGVSSNLRLHIELIPLPSPWYQRYLTQRSFDQ